MSLHRSYLDRAGRHLAARVRHTRSEPEAAAVVVEFAFALPILTFFLLGIIEFGVGWRQKIFVERAAQAAGRSAGSGGKDRLADFDALRSVDSMLNGATNLELTKVVVWKATSLDGEMPAACETSSQPGVCNVYSAAQVAVPIPTGFGSTAATNGTCTGGSWDSSWCPTTRDNSPPNADYVGVTVYAEYTTMTQLLPVGTLDFEATGVYHLEPSYVGR